MWVSIWLGANPFASAATCASTAPGDWNTAGTWTSCGGSVPQVGDDVTITHAVTITTQINKVNNITVSSGGSIIQDTNQYQEISGSMVFESGSDFTHAETDGGDVSVLRWRVEGDFTYNGNDINLNYDLQDFVI